MLVLSRLVANCLILLIVTYIGLSKDLIDCTDGPQGDEKDQQIQCDPSDNSSKSVHCPFIIVVEPDDYEPINCIKILNEGNDTVDGTPTITVGGIGHTFLFGDVLSKPGQRINYTVSIWAIPINKSATTLPPTTTTILTTTLETTVPETTTTETTITTTQKVETTTGGSIKGSASQIIIISIVAYYVLNFVS